MRWHVVVVECDIGGLACAGVRAARERTGLVVEQASSPGGLWVAKQKLEGTAGPELQQSAASFQPITPARRLRGSSGGRVPTWAR